MNKPNCCGEVIENTAMGKAFFYCRGCKSEVSNEEYHVVDGPRNALNVVAEMLAKNPPGPQPQAWVGPGVHGNGQPMVSGGQLPTHQWGGVLGGSQCTRCGDFSGSLSATKYCPGPPNQQSQQSQKCYHYGTKTKPNPVGGTDVVCANCTLSWWIP